MERGRATIGAGGYGRIPSLSRAFDLSDLHDMTLVEDLASWVNERFGLESDSAAKGGE
jgi:hypothetical protein